MALEALAEYDVKKPAKSFSTVEAEFFVSGRSDKGELLLKEPTDKVIVELKVQYILMDTEPVEPLTLLPTHLFNPVCHLSPW